jgi:hypothetical protein
VDNLATACQSFGYVEWTQYRDAIQSFLWVDKYDDKRYSSIWLAVEDAKARQSTEMLFTTQLEGVMV